MNTKLFPLLILIFILFHSSCGKTSSYEDTAVLSGNIDLSEAGTVNGPVFLLVSRTDDINTLEQDPMNTIVSVINVNKNGSFRTNLSTIGLSYGEKVYLIAFVDNDYNGGLPMPSPGDYLGFHIDRDTWKMAYSAGTVSEKINIKVNRLVYDYEASLEGVINFDEKGTVTLIAYNGEINSFDLKALDVDNIIGFKRMSVNPGQTSYSLRVLPYGKDLPIDGVYVIALFDRNKNGIPDSHDGIGFYTNNDTKGIPQRININEGVQKNIDIDYLLNLPEPSGHTVSVKGNFTAPPEYNGDSKPFFMIVAKTDDLNKIFNEPISVIKAFHKVDPGQNTFDIDLSYTDLKPDDDVMVIALWDLDNDGGFPNPTPDDRGGFYLNTDVTNYSFTETLVEGENTIIPQGDWTFDINRTFYEYDTTVSFTLDIIQPGGEALDISDGDPLIAVVVHEDGVNLSGKITDIDYVLGMENFAYNSDPAHIYSLSLFSAVFDDITDTETINSYIVVLYDRDGNGKPTEGVDDVAAYWLQFIWYFPKTYTVISDSDNELDKTVKFLGKKYGENLIF